MRYYISNNYLSMMGRIKCMVASMLALVLMGFPERAIALDDGGADAGERQSVGLVLSGGGAKGIAHIGVIQALEENDIPIDYITGTSMGSIVGGLYASGYTPKEMLDLILSKPFSYWSTGKIDPAESYYFSSESPSPAMVTLPISTKGDSIRNARSAVMASVISPMPMNFAFMELFAPHTAQCGGDFDMLFVPFHCVASDVSAKHKVVLRSGDLGYSIRSSMSFPIVFQPTSIDSMLLYDGGIYDNFPVDVMKEDFAPDFILGIDVSTIAEGPQTSLLDQLDNLVVQNNDYYLDPKDGIKIRFDLNEFGLLDFPQAEAIYKIGYDVTMQMMDSIKSRVSSRVGAEELEMRRQTFKSQTPYLRFDSVKVEGALPKQNRYISYLFAGSKGVDTFDVSHARSSYYRAISSGKFADLVPHARYDAASDMFSLDLKASVKDNFKVGLGGYVTSSTTSYVYVSAGYSTLSFSSISANVGAWLGQSYLGAMLTSRLYMHTPVPSALELEAVVFRQKYYEDDYLFFEDKLPSFVLNHEYFGRLKWAWATGSLSDMEAGVGFGHIDDSFYQSENEHFERDKCHYNLAQAFVRFESSTLDDINFPTSGHFYKATGMGVLGGYKQNYAVGGKSHKRQSWLQLELTSRNYFSLSRHFSLGVEADVMLSTRKLLHDYDASIVAAPAFQPTPSSYNAFNPAFRANSFIAVGVAPIYKINSNLSTRLQGYCFVPVRKILEQPDGTAAHSSRWLSHPVAYAEADICYKLPFASILLYCNYASQPKREWNVGISFGVFLPAPKYLR